MEAPPPPPPPVMKIIGAHATGTDRWPHLLQAQYSVASSVSVGSVGDAGIARIVPALPSAQRVSLATMTPFFAELVRLGAIVEGGSVAEGFSARTTAAWAAYRKQHPHLVLGVWAASGITPAGRAGDRKDSVSATHGRVWEAANRARHPSGAIAFEELLAARGIWNRGSRADGSVTECLKQYMRGRVERSDFYSKEVYSVDGMTSLGLAWTEAAAQRLNALLVDNNRDSFTSARMVVQFSVGWKVDWDKFRVLIGSADGERVRNLLPGSAVDGWPAVGTQCLLLGSDRFIQQVRTRTPAGPPSRPLSAAPVVDPAASTDAAGAVATGATDDPTRKRKVPLTDAQSAAELRKENIKLKAENVRLSALLEKATLKSARKDELLLAADVRLRKIKLPNVSRGLAPSVGTKRKRPDGLSYSGDRVTVDKNPLCQHQRRKSRCKDCGGSGLCEHKRVKHLCKECKGNSICEHQRRRSRCKECGGGELCVHKRERNTCKECGGGSICVHKTVRSRCRECGGGSICVHKRRRSQCKDCRAALCIHRCAITHS